MERFIRILPCIICAVIISCAGDYVPTGGKASASYSVCPVEVIPSLNHARQVDYDLRGYVYDYSYITVCFRRIGAGGRAKSYAEFTDSRKDPNKFQTYHTYVKLSPDETGVKVYWVELTDKISGKTKRYINYKL